jgi:hypothetical protein
LTQFFAIPPSLEQIQAKAFELIDEINGLMNFESKTRGLSVKPPTSLAEINTSVEPSTFVVWLLHVKAFVYFLLGMATKRTAIAHSRFLADRRLHRFCLTTQPVVVWQRKLKSIERDSVLACF